MVNSVRDGHLNNDVIKRPDIVINKLIEAGIFDEDAVLGRLQFGTLKRTGLNVTMRYLVAREEELKEFIEDNTSYHADEAFNVLCFGVILAVMNGHTEAESPVLKSISSITKVLPPAMVQKLVTSTQTISKLINPST